MAQILRWRVWIRGAVSERCNPCRVGGTDHCINSRTKILNPLPFQSLMKTSLLLTFSFLLASIGLCQETSVEDAFLDLIKSDGKSPNSVSAKPSETTLMLEKWKSFEKEKKDKLKADILDARKVDMDREGQPYPICRRPGQDGEGCLLWNLSSESRPAFRKGLSAE